MQNCNFLHIFPYRNCLFGVLGYFEKFPPVGFLKTSSLVASPHSHPTALINLHYSFFCLDYAIVNIVPNILKLLFPQFSRVKSLVKHVVKVTVVFSLLQAFTITTGCIVLYIAFLSLSLLPLLASNPASYFKSVSVTKGRIPCCLIFLCFNCWLAFSCKLAYFWVVFILLSVESGSSLHTVLFVQSAEMFSVLLKWATGFLHFPSLLFSYQFILN